MTQVVFLKEKIKEMAVDLLLFADVTNQKIADAAEMLYPKMSNKTKIELIKSATRSSSKKRSREKI